VRRHDWRLLVIIVLIVAVSGWVDWPANPGLHINLGPIDINRDIGLQQGLDLRGGLAVLLAADVPESQPVDRDTMGAAKVIVENRINALGVTEPFVQLQGDRHIVVELPGVQDPDRAIAAIHGTGLLEFVDAGTTSVPAGSTIRTTNKAGGEGETAQYFAGDQVFQTIFTGSDLANASASTGELPSSYEVNLEFKPDGAQRFAEYTRNNVGRILAIVIDGVVISSPRIENPIPEGRARITGDFTYDEARSLAVQLKYGALPVPLRVEETRSVGPTLGQDSVRKSVRAGVVGLSVVLVFMAIYYRVPGLLADLALISYALINLALYKTIPVTITLPGVTGFLLSTGMAVDANILIFERMKEELRWGRPLGGAIEAGFSRAWTSIRDSNLSVIITCLVLFWFGSNFGATQVKGFAVTLFLGVLISMFTALIVTRTLVRLVFRFLGSWLRGRPWALGA